MPSVTQGIIKSHVETIKGTLPDANANLLTTAIMAARTNATLKCEFEPTVAGVLTVTRTLGGVTTSATLYGGSSLTAGVSYPFEVTASWDPTTGLKETINFRYSATSGYYRLIVRE